VKQHGIRVLNVAGSRASEEPGIYKLVSKVLDETFAHWRNSASKTE
jgi:Circularly permutated YpsA SLOG family